jgi:hypothetical protein
VRGLVRQGGYAQQKEHVLSAFLEVRACACVRAREAERVTSFLTAIVASRAMNRS